MASYTSGQRKHLAMIEDMIARGHRMGLCDSDGNSVSGEDGRMAARPRAMNSAVRRYKYDRKTGVRTPL